MTCILIFILVCFGCTNILAYGSIFNSIRPKYKFFHCPMCIGFWVGVLFSFFLHLPIEYIIPSWITTDADVSTFMKDGIALFAGGCLSSGTSYLLAMIIGDGGIQHEHKSTKILGKGL